ncbi:MAG TPA: hypothetical protein VGK50_02575 [Coriobacteriia bacterium]|jgi:hypothetical protein
MDFSVICPNDGPVEVGLEGISTIIFRGLESVVIIFVCPRCGSEIHVPVQLPDLFVAAVELDPEGPFSLDEDIFDISQVGRRPERAEPPTPVDPRRIDRYCEYFRRQLASADDVDAALAEIDSKPRKA